MKHTLKAALAATILAGTMTSVPGLAADATYKIDQVIITGNKALATDALLSKVPFHHGQKVPQSQVAGAAQAILQAYNAVSTVSVEIDVKLNPNKALNAYNAVFALTETPAAIVETKVAPKLHALVFDGNTKIDSDTLAAALGVKPGDDLSNDKVKAMQVAIVAQYAAKKVNVAVSGENKKNDDGSYDVLWHITEKLAKKQDDAQ
jgi:outer membrane protein assembly factor BamA